MEKKSAQMMLDFVGRKPANQPVRLFCEENNLSEARYYYWRNKLNKIQQESFKEEEGTFIPIQVRGGSVGKSALASIDLFGRAVIHIYDPIVIPALKHIF